MACAPPLVAAQVVHAFVALCDNATQGIVPVPAKIGNGDDPAHNLYWGCSDGLRSYFGSSKQWRMVQSQQREVPSPILEECLFKHRERDLWLVAQAYRGANIKDCLAAFLRAAADGLPVAVPGEWQTHFGGQAPDVIAFIGHNGLMDFRVPFPKSQRSGRPVPAIVLCCKSDDYFTEGLRTSGATPTLMTRQLMYPGSFLLHAALEGWMRDEPPTRWLDRAAQAYAGNQKISLKAARGVFVVP
jgi:hypothetical protein